VPKMLRSLSLSLAILLTIALAASSESPYFTLKGDLHVHSSFSHDSDVPVAQAVEESRDAGYDFIALTDHNTTRHMREDHSIGGLLVIPGYEHTTPAAHINIFGLRDIPRKSAIYTKDDMEAYLEPLRAQGGVFQLNHPNDELYYSRFGYDLDFHFLEVLNSAWREDDHQTLNDWHGLLVEGRKIVATGGTDAHRNHTARQVYNNVLVTDYTEEAILEALMAGRNYVTTSPDGPAIHMAVGDVVMGGTATYEEGQTISIQLHNVAPHTIMRIYSDRGLELQVSCSKEESGFYELELSTEHKRFVRLELWFDETSICAFSNPIYIEH
jgi:predicted metal-dependent phosphoesterase TrpH